MPSIDRARARGDEILATAEVRAAIGAVPVGVRVGRARRCAIGGVDGSVLGGPVRRGG